MNPRELQKLVNQEKELLEDIAKSTQGAMGLIRRAKLEFGYDLTVNDAIRSLARLQAFAKLKLQNNG